MTEKAMQDCIDCGGAPQRPGSQYCSLRCETRQPECPRCESPEIYWEGEDDGSDGEWACRACENADYRDTRRSDARRDY